jgi:hypothetical protein
MRKTLMFALLLPLSASGLLAQQGSSAGKTSGNKAGPATLQGCLQLSGGRYTLTEDGGTTHELTGLGSKLSHQIGHQVELTGKPSTKTTNSTTYGGASSAEIKPVFDVKTVTQMADTCKSPDKWRIDPRKGFLCPGN